MTLKVPTLLEDWQQRRAWLLTRPNPYGKDIAREQINVFDYLIKRYGSQPEASEAARFPMTSAALILNRRMMIIHHHLKCGPTGKIETKSQAQSKASSILQKIEAQDPQSEMLTAKPETPVLDKLAMALEHARASVRNLVALDAQKPFESTPQVQHKESRPLEHAFRTLLPEYSEPGQPANLEQLVVELEDLRRMRHPDVPEYVALAWRKNLMAKDRTKVVVLLENFLRDDSLRSRSAELFRAELGNTNHLIRSRALEMLCQIGDLQDLGLVADLLNMPPQDDDHAGERAALLNALRKLSGKSSSKPQTIARFKS